MNGQWSDALNPRSKKSGIVYRLAGVCTCQGEEMLDYSLMENISLQYKRLGVFNSISIAFQIVVGTHYDLFLSGRDNCRGGSKGLLDFFIFPLIARKLIADAFEDRECPCCAWLVVFSPLFWIGVLLEGLRMVVGAILTILILPVVFLVGIGKKTRNVNPDDGIGGGVNAAAGL